MTALNRSLGNQRNALRRPGIHSIGREIPQEAGRTTAGALAACGLDWTVSEHALRSVFGEVPDVKAIYRSTDNAYVGTVGDGRPSVQNAEVASIADGPVNAGALSWTAGGSSKEGAICWMAATGRREHEIVAGTGDTVKGHVLFTWSHDGSRSITARYIPIRPWCANQLATLHGGNKAAIVIRHSGNVDSKRREACRLMDAIVATQAETVEFFRSLASRNVTADERNRIIRAVFAADAAQKTDADRTAREATRIERVTREVFDHLERGEGSHVARGTAWHLYNAMTEMVDHPLAADSVLGFSVDSVLGTDEADRLMRAHLLPSGTAQEYRDRATQAVARLLA